MAHLDKIFKFYVKICSSMLGPFFHPPPTHILKKSGLLPSPTTTSPIAKKFGVGELAPKSLASPPPKKKYKSQPL